MTAHRITFWVNSLRGGGSERVCVTVSNYLYDHGYAVDLIVSNMDGAVYRPGHELHGGIQIIHLKANHTRHTFFALLRYIRDNNPSVFLTFSHQQAIMLILLRCLLRTNTRIISRTINMLSYQYKHTSSFWHKYIVHWIIKRLYRYADHVIAQSKWMKDDLVTNYRINPRRVTVVYNPMPKEIEIILHNEGAEARYKEIDLLYVGRLSAQKGLDYLLDAFAICLQKRPGLRLIMVGDGIEKHRLRKKAASMGIEQNIYFEGFQKNIIPYYLKAKLTVLSSLYEGFPNVIVESIALGTPVVSFNCPSGPSELIEDGINGRLAAYKSVDDLAQKMMMALDDSFDVGAMKQTVHRFLSSTSLNQYRKIIKQHL